MSSSSTSQPVNTLTSRKVQHGVKRKREDSSTSKDATVKRVAVGDSDHDQDSSSSSSDASKDDSDGDTAEEAKVLSHAAQRKLKKKKLQICEQEPASSPAADADVPVKRQNSIWVGNLAYKTTVQSLRAFFQRCVPGCEVTRVHLPMKTKAEAAGEKGMRGENRGFAYVDFSTKDAKEHAISLSEQNLDGRKLLIKDGGDFTGRPTTGTQTESTAGAATGKSKTAQRILAAQKQPPAPTLFLGNLGFQITQTSIKDMLEGHMKSRRQQDTKISSKEEAESEAPVTTTDTKNWIRNIRMGTFEDSGLCKGWAFVDFFSIEDATAVLLDPRNHRLDGRKLVVEYASPDAVRRGGGQGPKKQDNKQTLRSKRDASSAGKQDTDERKSNGGAKRKPMSENSVDQGEMPKKRVKLSDGTERGGKGRRPKPGAALALAKREQVAIVPSTGTKIIF